MTLTNNQQPRILRSGFTLVEMLVAMTLSLVLFLAVAEMFSQLGGIMDDGRALIEMSGELRGVTHTLQQDLDNRTVEVQPWIQPGTNQGYFEIVEGPDRDRDFVDPAVNLTIQPNAGDIGEQVTMGGDADDILAFTAYSKDEPFVGLVKGRLQSVPAGSNGKYKYYLDPTLGGFTAITSQYAEIVYWTRCTTNDDRQFLLDSAGVDAFTDKKRDWDETVTLYRRVLLIRPDIFIGNVTTVSGNVTFTINTATKYAEMRNYFDLSIRQRETSGNARSWLTNSLEDLQNRQFRIAHFFVDTPSGQYYPGATPSTDPYPLDQPFPLRPRWLKSYEQLAVKLGANNLRDRTGEDVVLAKALSFDVRVFDPDAPIYTPATSSVAVQPGDIGYSLPGTRNNTGAYVDLNWNDNNYSVFSGRPHIDSGLQDIRATTFDQMPTTQIITATTRYQAYDTWPFLYEMDGIDSDNDNQIDQGTNGFDDNSNNIIDDAGELETSPPYPEPLRGIQVQIRVYEDGTRQIRQDTVMGDFIPG